MSRVFRGERPCFSGTPRLAGVPGLLTVSSQSSASARESIYLPHIILIRQSAVIHWFFSLIAECLLLSCCAKRQITAVKLADV